mgnify:CR=1 FL=1
MTQNLEKITNEKYILTQSQMNYRIDKLRYMAPFGLKNFSIKAYILKKYYEFFYDYILEKKN